MNTIDPFIQLFGKSPALTVLSPGRVNLLGEHVDYNDGPVLPAAIDRMVQLSASPSKDDHFILHALDLNKRTEFTLQSLPEKKDIQGNPLPGWALYPAGVVHILHEAGYGAPNFQAVYSSTIPIGAGLSSSAAVEVAFAIALQALGGWEADRMRLAQFCQQAENQYVGVSSGLMDQFASMHGVKDHALYFDTRSLEWEAVPLPTDTVLVIADSGVRRSLKTSAYNDRKAACEEAVKLLSKYKPDLRSLRDLSNVEFAAYSPYLPETIRKRAEHVVREINRVESAVTALRIGEYRSFGALMFAGHASLRDLYEVSTVELDMLVKIARGLPGCLGARLTGAGFGGCTVNLVEEKHTESFIFGLQGAYQAQMRREIQVYVCKASDGASVERMIQ